MNTTDVLFKKRSFIGDLYVLYSCDYSCDYGGTTWWLKNSYITTSSQCRVSAETALLDINIFPFFHAFLSVLTAHTICVYLGGLQLPKSLVFVTTRSSLFKLVCVLAFCFTDTLLPLDSTNVYGWAVCGTGLTRKRLALGTALTSLQNGRNHRTRSMSVANKFKSSQL